MSRIGQQIDELTVDHQMIYATMGQPHPSPDQTRIRHVRSGYGHPDAARSDWLRDLAGVLAGWEDVVRDREAHSPRRHRLGEHAATCASLTYLRAQVRVLARVDEETDGVVGGELAVLHRMALVLTDQARPDERVSVPCPQCGVLALSRHVGVDGGDRIRCGQCGVAYEAERYGWLVRLAMHAVMSAART
ncbi:MAG: hypothetical protein ACYCV4_02000 [Dermatophilaceae bacterium]